MLEITGMVATTLVFISFLFTNVKWIRMLNLVGSIFFVIYGFGIGAFWTGFMNAGLVFVNLYHLIKLQRGKNDQR